MSLIAMGEQRAQATVEMAIVAPVMIVVALIVYNIMIFASATARFDRIAPDIVLAHGVAPAGVEQGGVGASMAGEVEGHLARAMEGYDVTVEVVLAEGTGISGLSGAPAQGAKPGGGALLSMVGALRTYRCILRYEPWPQGFSIAGVSSGSPLTLTHERAVIIDPWRSGVVV